MRIKVFFSLSLNKDNKMEGYQSSLDGSEDNFKFNDDYDDDA